MRIHSPSQQRTVDAEADYGHHGKFEDASTTDAVIYYAILILITDKVVVIVVDTADAD